MKKTFTEAPPSPFQRASNWAHFGNWAVFGDWEPGMPDWCLSATEDGRIEAIGRHTVTIGSWRVEGDTLIVEVDPEEAE